MHAPVTSLRDGYHSVTPYLIVKGAARAIAFYEKAFDARPRLLLPAPGGGIAHAELSIGDSVVMLADEFPGMAARCPGAIGGTPVSLLIYVEDVDAIHARAVAAGARPLGPLENRFYGDRSGQVQDPFGHIWTLASHIEDVTPEQLQARMEAVFSEIVPT